MGTLTITEFSTLDGVGQALTYARVGAPTYGDLGAEPPV